RARQHTPAEPEEQESGKRADDADRDRRDERRFLMLLDNRLRNARQPLYGFLSGPTRKINDDGEDPEHCEEPEGEPPELAVLPHDGEYEDHRGEDRADDREMVQE